MKISEMSPATNLLGTEQLMIVQDGVTKRISLADLANAQPNDRGVYPDVPINRVEMRRISGQTSTVVTLAGNLGMIDRLFALCFPCLLDSNSNVVAYLNGKDVRKTADGADAPISDPSLQNMVRLGGFYHKYEYDASNNTKISKFSVLPVKGYKYVRRRYIGMYNGYVENSKLLSIADKYSTQSIQMQTYHTYAKNTGANYREIAMQDYEVYRWLFFLFHKTYNSQSVYEGVTQMDWGWWGAFKNPDNTKPGGYGQPYKTGVTNDIAGHYGQKTAVVTNDNGASKTIKPYKFLWCEDLLAGPFWIWCTGRIKKGGIWYEFKDLSKIAFSVTADATAVCDEALKGSTTTEGDILECFEDTMIATQVGASSTTGMCDHYWRATDSQQVYVPAVVGGSNYGSQCGVSVLASDHVPSYSSVNFGGCLASDDPTDTTPDGTLIV